MKSRDYRYFNLSYCEKILNKDSNKYSEKEIKEIRDVIYNLSLIIMDFNKSSQ
jgi:hypothetical protein